MIQFNTIIDVDDSAIPNAIDAIQDDCLSRGGERIAEKAKKSIIPSRRMTLQEIPKEARKRYAKGKRPLPGIPSRPGDPPHSISGILPGLIGSAVSQHIALIGAEKSSKRGYPAAATLEFGRSYTLFGRQVTIEPRPYMAPALIAVLPTLANDFKDSIKG